MTCPNLLRFLPDQPRADDLRAHLATWMPETSDVFPWEPDPRLESVLRRELGPR